MGKYVHSFSWGGGELEDRGWKRDIHDSVNLLTCQQNVSDRLGD
jgi:hypothetical protein